LFNFDLLKIALAFWSSFVYAYTKRKNNLAQKEIVFNKKLISIKKLKITNRYPRHFWQLARFFWQVSWEYNKAMKWYIIWRKNWLKNSFIKLS